jgi:hypothetical protein
MCEESWTEESISDESCESIKLPEASCDLAKTPSSIEELSLLSAVNTGDYTRVKAALDRGCDIDTRDSHGATPLLIAVKKVKTSRKYFAIVTLLLSYGADPHLKDSEGWAAMDAAVASQDRALAGLLFEYMSTRRLLKWQGVKSLTAQALQHLTDFYLEIKWELSSPIIPLISTLGPSDVCSMWKSSDSLRLDTSLVGWKNFSTKRRHMSVVFNSTGEQPDLVLVNHAKKVISDPFEPVDPEEREMVLTDILRRESVQGEVSLHNCSISPSYSWRNKLKTKSISGFSCVKYNVKVQARLNYKHKVPSAAEKLVSKVKELTVNLWVSDEFPLSLQDFLPMLALLSQVNQTMQKLYEFMSNGAFISQLPPLSFPVKIGIPLTMTVRAMISFINFQVMKPDPQIFALPDYQWQPRKVAQKTLSCPKKRMFLASMAV